MSRLLLSAGALALMATTALAGDVTVAERSWTGFYIGGNANWNFLNTDISSGAQDFGSVSFDAQNYGSQSGNSLGGGIQFGFDYQLGDAVLGIQAFTSVTGLDSSASVKSEKLGTELTTFGNLNARLGYLLQPDLLAYAKGGLAFGSFKYTDKDSTEGYSGSQSDIRRQGWMVGGGVEYRFAPSWTAFAEYDYTDFGEESVELDYKNGYWGDTFKMKYDQNISSAVVGVNYRF